jgi:8-oxo-dGTP pyrophosphatase MutT (NUDIX family)
MLDRVFTSSVYAVHRGEVLLVNHKRQRAWVPPGGRMEPGERPIETAVREIQEELGWKIDRDYRLAPQDPDAVAGTPAGLIAYEEHASQDQGIHMNFAFAVLANHRNVVLCDEFTDVRWVSSTAWSVDPVPVNVKQLVLKSLARFG